MNGDLGKRLARLEAAVPARLSANRPLSMAACNQLRKTIGEPLMTAVEYAAFLRRPPLNSEARQALLARLLEGAGVGGEERGQPLSRLVPARRELAEYRARTGPGIDSASR